MDAAERAADKAVLKMAQFSFPNTRSTEVERIAVIIRAAHADVVKQRDELLAALKLLVTRTKSQRDELLAALKLLVTRTKSLCDTQPVHPAEDETTFWSIRTAIPPADEAIANAEKTDAS